MNGSRPAGGDPREEQNPAYEPLGLAYPEYDNEEVPCA